MCRAISWIETGSEKVLFITSKDLKTKKGKELIEFLEGDLSDLKGHGAIRYYFGLKARQGRAREVNDLSSPKNFPKEIVKAVKNLEFKGIWSNTDLLNAKGRKEWAEVNWSEFESQGHIPWERLVRIKQSNMWKVFRDKKYRNKNWK